RLEEHSRAADQRYRDLEQARDRLKAEFRQMAQEILEDKARRFSEQNASQLGQLLNPLREQIGDFRRLVSESYEKEGKERAGLQAELRQLFELNRQLAEEADSLTRALTADNRTQGYWGELKLERLLESAGLKRASSTSPRKASPTSMATAIAPTPCCCCRKTGRSSSTPRSPCWITSAPAAMSPRPSASSTWPGTPRPCAT